MCECVKDLGAMDLATPRNAYLTAFYKRSFAYYTMKERVPVILTTTLDLLVRHKEDIVNKYGKESQADLKAVIGELSKLKYEVQTNKPLRPLISDSPDIKFYNDYLGEQGGNDGRVTYFHCIWLLAECYIYRRIRETFELTTNLRSYDPFQSQKQQQYEVAKTHASQLANYCLSLYKENDAKPSPSEVKQNFIKLLKLNLWGNMCDLSLSLGKVGTEVADPLESYVSLDPFILSDHSEEVWQTISKVKSRADIVDIVFDNSGYELFTDLCLADFIVSMGFAKSIRFYVKTIPWFISDVMSMDFNWTLQQMLSSRDESLRQLGNRWNSHVNEKTWTVIDDDFWTYPVSFSSMASVKPELYAKLGEAKLVIFKGDLNYRKLFGEKNWDPTTPVDVALEGFHPSTIVTLRTVKADIICGLKPGIAEERTAEDSEWMRTGKWGLIQFSDKSGC